MQSNSLTSHAAQGVQAQCAGREPVMPGLWANTICNPTPDGIQASL